MGAIVLIVARYSYIDWWLQPTPTYRAYRLSDPKGKEGPL